MSQTRVVALEDPDGERTYGEDRHQEQHPGATLAALGGISVEGLAFGSYGVQCNGADNDDVNHENQERRDSDDMHVADARRLGCAQDKAADDVPGQQQQAHHECDVVDAHFRSAAATGAVERHNNCDDNDAIDDAPQRKRDSDHGPVHTRVAVLSSGDDGRRHTEEDQQDRHILRTGRRRHQSATHLTDADRVYKAESKKDASGRMTTLWYVGAHAAMLVHPTIVNNFACALGTKAAAGTPRFDAGWVATETPDGTFDALAFMVVHYLVHNALWLLHLWRALHPQHHELLVPYLTQCVLLALGLVVNIVCVLPAADRNVVGVPTDVDWLFVPVVTHANSFLLTRVCWSWLVCVQVLSFGADWRLKAMLLGWLVIDVLSLLVLRVATLPALVITALTAAWAYRRFGWRRVSTSSISSTIVGTAGANYADLGKAKLHKQRRRQQKQPKKEQTPWDSDEEDFDADDDDAKEDEDDETMSTSAVFEIGTPDDFAEIEKRRRMNAKRSAAAAAATISS